MASRYLFDTHALIFWNLKQGVSDKFIEFFDEQADKGNVLVSAVSFWETALLSKKQFGLLGSDQSKLLKL